MTKGLEDVIVSHQVDNEIYFILEGYSIREQILLNNK